jgi:hypothetical protein
MRLIIPAVHRRQKSPPKATLEKNPQASTSHAARRAAKSLISLYYLAHWVAGFGRWQSPRRIRWGDCPDYRICMKSLDKSNRLRSPIDAPRAQRSTARAVSSDCSGAADVARLCSAVEHCLAPRHCGRLHVATRQLAARRPHRSNPTGRGAPWPTLRGNAVVPRGAGALP